ncbi:hypothetical protein [Enterovibrio paralichthyis]|nr:hypothetical protein [Enterovibrio paralichthyis]
MKQPEMAVSFLRFSLASKSMKSRGKIHRCVGNARLTAGDVRF